MSLLRTLKDFRFRLFFGVLQLMMLTSIMGGNSLRSVDQKKFLTFQTDSETLIEVKIVEMAENHPLWEGGFLRMNKPFFQRRENHGLMDFDRNATERYNSQLGLQGLVAAVFQKCLQTNPGVSVWFLKWMVAFSTAAALVFFLHILMQKYGLGAGCAGFVILCFSSHITYFGSNLYWVPATLFLPYIVAFAGYPQAFESRQKFVLYTYLISGCVLLKCLCGYEYISCIVAAPVVAIIFHGLAAGKPWLTIARYSFVVAIAGCLAFVAALVIHIGLLAVPLGGLKPAAAAVFERASSHTIAHKTFDESWLQKYIHGPRGTVLLITKYLSADAVNIGTYTTFGNGEYFLVRGTYLGLFISGAIVAGCQLFRRKQSGWASLVGLGFSLLVSSSWLFLAKNHSLHHLHLNHIVFGIPFLFQLIVAFSVALQKVQAD